MTAFTPPTKNLFTFPKEQVNHYVTDAELADIKSSGQNAWKDWCLFLLAIAVPTVINAVALLPDAVTHGPQGIRFQPGLMLFVNACLGIASATTSGVFGAIWRSTAKKTDDVYTRIIQRPKYDVASPPTAIDVGPITAPVARRLQAPRSTHKKIPARSKKPGGRK